MSGGFPVLEHELELGENDIPISTSGGPVLDNFLTGKIEHLTQGVIVGKAGLVLSDLAELAVEALNSAVHGDAQDNIGCLGLVLMILLHLVVNGVQKYERIHHLQWPVLPYGYFRHNLFADLAGQLSLLWFPIPNP